MNTGVTNRAEVNTGVTNRAGVNTGVTNRAGVNTGVTNRAGDGGINCSQSKIMDMEGVPMEGFVSCGKC